MKDLGNYEGVKVISFTHLEPVSHYNYNFYKGLESDLVLGISDDDNVTEWYIYRNLQFIEFAISYTNEEDILHLI